jgi:hypothetical protein
MKAPSEYRPRVTFELTPEQDIFIKGLPWGVQRPLFSTIVDDLMALHREHGNRIIAMVLARALSLPDYYTIAKECKEELKRKEVADGHDP